MANPTELVRDVMQVCRNGHVITDTLRSCPGDSVAYCPRCGEHTLNGCPGCGEPLPGAVREPGLPPLGVRQPPLFCGVCGTGFPWARPTAAPPSTALAQLEGLLRRLPRMVRQLRTRQEGRVPFRVEDEKDLEDLLRAVLPLHFDDIRPEARTPRYASGNRTDFVLPRERLALVLKRVRSELTEEAVLNQLDEDVGYYRRRGGCTTLVCYLYDPAGRLHQAGRLEGVYTRQREGLGVHCVVGEPAA